MSHILRNLGLASFLVIASALAQTSSDSSNSGTTPSTPPVYYYSFYGYTPTRWICILFVVLFGLSTLIHVGQAVRSRLWWMFPTAILAGVGEVIGWCGRLWSSSVPWRLDPYLMQICSTIIAPTPLLAANFIILAKIIEQLGPQYSRLRPRMYAIVFCSFDIIALVIQAVGGAQASIAVQSDNGDPEKGGHIMLGGIIFQMFSITMYALLAAEFFVRWSWKRPMRAVSTDIQHLDVKDGQTGSSLGNQHDLGKTSNNLPVVNEGGRSIGKSKLHLMVAGLIFSTVVIFIRSVYRTIELSDGWTGRINHTQVYFNVLDGAMILLAMICLNVLHPGWLLKPE